VTSGRKEAAKKVNGRMMSDTERMNRRVKEHAKVKADEDKAYKATNERHAKEMDEAEKTGQVFARHAVSHEAKKIDQTGLNSRDRAEYQNLVRHFGNEDARVHKVVLLDTALVR
jgi:hypothetical protein